MLAEANPDAYFADLAMSLNDLACTQSDMGQRDEALPSIAEAVRIRRALAESNPKGARQQFELAASVGYRAARIDLANLLVDGSAGMLDPKRAVLLYQQAWQDGVPIAAFELGHLYEEGVSVSYANAASTFHPDLALAWSWYEKGANAGEPHALARFAERDESDALGTSDPQKRTALALTAFSYYAAAAERAH